MSELLVKAVIFITLALVFYTIGVWSEKISGRLKVWHVITFYLGLVCDTLGTKFMGDIAGGFELSLHGITGALAIILMFFHAIWGTYVLVKKDEEKIKKFHKFSLIVWAIWLIPYLLGMFVGMGII